MKKHSDKDRFLIAHAMLKSKAISEKGKSVALDCILAYVEDPLEEEFRLMVL